MHVGQKVPARELEHRHGESFLVESGKESMDSLLTLEYLHSQPLCLIVQLA